MLFTSEVKVKLYIKYMVSLRCKLLVKEELRRSGIKYSMIYLGVVELQEEITPKQREELKENLLESGLELLDDKKSILIERVKELLLYNELNLTEIAYRLHYSSVAHLSNQFRKLTGITPSYFKKLKLNRRRKLEIL